MDQVLVRYLAFHNIWFMMTSSRSSESKSHNRKWIIYSTCCILPDTLTDFSARVTIKVKRNDSNRKQLSEPGSQGPAAICFYRVIVIVNGR